MRVYVLMSTYNGERFVVEQVNSILVQLPVEGRLLVRDDGSTDSTPDKIASIVDPRIEIVRGENIGFARSFLTLLQQTPPDAEMVMFADQDDVWLPFKIQRAWDWLMPHADSPALYCSAQELVDEYLTPLQRTPPWPRPPSFTGAIVENIVTGCTAALNKLAADLLKQGGVPSNVHFHDWWLYLVVSAFGTVLVDDEATLLYRQHGANVIGRGAGWWRRQAQMVRFLSRHDWVRILLNQVAELRRCYGHQLSDRQNAVLQRYFRFLPSERASPRCALITGTQHWRQTTGDEILLRILLLARVMAILPISKR